MALPHRIVGLICELGKAQTDGTEFPDGSTTMGLEEDRHKLRKHEHICTGSSDDVFERHPESVEKANHHYFANYPNQLLLTVRGTLQGGSEPYDVSTSTKNVICDVQEESQDNLPSWMTVWLEPAECVIDFLNYTTDFEGIDEGNPQDWASIQDEDGVSYNEDSARAEAQALFDLYCDELRASLQPYQVTTNYAANGDPVDKIYPRWKTETEYEDPEVEPYETQACPTTTSFICPWYKAYSNLGFQTNVRNWYDFSFKISSVDWGPWKITDGSGIWHDGEEGSYWREEQVWVDESYWADTDGDGVDEWIEAGYWDTIWVEEFYSYPGGYTYKTYEFYYPYDVRSSYDVKSRWKIKCDYRPDPTCCGPAGKQITFGIKIYKANLVSALPNGGGVVETYYSNCNLKGYGYGRSGDRGVTQGRGIQYFDGHNCPSSTIGYEPMHWAYYGTIVRPIFTTSDTESVVYVTKTIGEAWNDVYDIEIPSYEGKVTYIKDFWIESIT
jgi:hypothetical protein